MVTKFTRRCVLTVLSSAGVAPLLPMPRSLAAEPALETTMLRISRQETVCIAPQYVAEELLRAEGFTDIRYIEVDENDNAAAIARGVVDLSLTNVADAITAVDGGNALTLLGGVHAGCVEVFANELVHSVTDLKGKRVGVISLNSPSYIFVAIMAAYVGLDPAKDIRWVLSEPGALVEWLQKGKIDAFLTIPPYANRLRAEKIGRVVVSMTIDRPWSQYFCCLLAANPQFVRKYPVATKRAYRAILKAAEFCAAEPARAARQLVDRGFAPADLSAETRQFLGELPYDKWREYDPEDTIRFYALRMHEIGLIKTRPQKIIAENTDWRFLNELKRGLKA